MDAALHAVAAELPAFADGGPVDDHVVVPISAAPTFAAPTGPASPAGPPSFVADGPPPAFVADPAAGTAGPRTPASVATPAADYAFEPLQRHEPVAGPARHRAPSAAETLAAAHVEAERIREEARREGFAAGHAAGMDEARAALEPAARSLAAALQEAMAQGDLLAAELEREAVELALVVAEKVVAGAIEERPERVLDVITGALRGLLERRRLTILVHPDDAELVRDRIDAICDELGGVEHCEVRAERRVARGGALLRTPDGELDVRLDAKLQRAADVLREVPA